MTANSRSTAERGRLVRIAKLDGADRMNIKERRRAQYRELQAVQPRDTGTRTGFFAAQEGSLCRQAFRADELVPERHRIVLSLFSAFFFTT